MAYGGQGYSQGYIFPQEQNSSMRCTQKHADFVTESMMGKPVGKIPGIGRDSSFKLQQKGIYMAYEVLAEFLRLNMNEDMFRLSLISIGITSNNVINHCVRALREWCANHL